MSNFLDFLNTADLNTLTQVSGVNRQLAGNLIAARPFDHVDDALNVKGMGKATLARLQSFAEGQGNESENSALIPVQEEAMPAPVEKTPPAQDEVKEGDSFLKRLWRAFVAFLRALIRLIMLVILFTAVGAMFYYGLPYIRETFIAPVEENTAQIQELETEIESLQTQLDEINARVGALEDSVEAHTASIEKLEAMQATLETQLQENNDAVLLELKHEVMFARALDVLARGRLYLAQSNFGLAKLDVQTARDLLAELQAEKDDDVLAKAIERLDLSLGNLPDFPVIASGDLEIAWQILISGNAPAATATFTPTPAPIETATSITPTVEQTATPTPFPPVSPTP
ncbi:MAG: helix-hairpin-helix domain-containing protein [Anaerolineae bacterium]|nr:helix-hairpin-helix domain-containing protein [Anaerolineae bacterium]